MSSLSLDLSLKVPLWCSCCCPPLFNLVFLFFIFEIVNNLWFLQVLSRYAKPIYEGPPGRELVPEAKREEETPLSDWELVKGYFGKLHVLMAILSLTAVFLHIGFASPKASATLIRWGFDLPDSLSEFLFSAIVVLQVEKVVKMVHQFLQARYWQCELIFLPACSMDNFVLDDLPM